MKYGAIKKYDIADGEGVRVSLFVSGCRNRCKGCFQPQTWDFDYGYEYTRDTEDEIINALKEDYISGLSILGGDPLEPENIKQVEKLCIRVKSEYPSKNIWLYTGYHFEKLLESNVLPNVVDVVVDGEFIEEKRNLMLRFRGSENQRVIDVKKTIDEGRIVLYIE